MEGFLPIEKGEKAEVKTFVNEEDEAALIKSIRDARRRSDVVIASLHSHEGVNENWYAPVPPIFVEEYAHNAIDAGATPSSARQHTTPEVWKSIRDTRSSTIWEA